MYTENIKQNKDPVYFWLRANKVSET